MTDKPTRRELLKPLHLLAIAGGAGVFAAIVTLVSTGAFTERVNRSLAMGTYAGMPPVLLGLVVGGIAFIATLLILAMLMLAIDPAEIAREVDRPVLLGPDDPSDATPDASAPDNPPAPTA